jgi:hypothetical protein
VSSGSPFGVVVFVADFLPTLLPSIVDVYVAQAHKDSKAKTNIDYVGQNKAKEQAQLQLQQSSRGCHYKAK